MSENIGDRFFDNLEIETPSGFVKFDGIRKMPKKVNTIKVTLENGKCCEVSENHLFVVCGIGVHVKELEKNKTKLQCDDGNYYTVKDIQKLEKKDYVYDILSVNNEDSSYFADGIAHHNCSFTGSSQTLIRGEILEQLIGEEPSTNGILEDGRYLVWRPPLPNHLYGFGVDVSQGVQADSAVINVFDITTYKITGRLEQSATWYANDADVFELSDKIIEIAPHWNMPFIIVENNALGSVLMKQLHFEESYEHLFYDIRKGEYGINANTATKPLALTYFKEDVESGRMKIRSKQMIKELAFFEEVKEGIFKSRKGRQFHDDHVTSAYWVSYMVKDSWFKDAYEHRLEMMGIKQENIVFKDQREMQTEAIVNAFMNSLNKQDRMQFDFEEELWRE